jgi:aryl-alcohol dehydrogenase-like predicted oxidoreductase
VAELSGIALDRGTLRRPRPISRRRKLMMRYRLFGGTGLRVSELCLGTMTFGNSDWGASEDESKAIYTAFRDAGGNFLDSANEVYADGRSEEITGRLVKGARDEHVIATKYSFQSPGTRNLNASGNHRKSLRRSVEASLKRLGTDYLDILWLHGWDETTPQEEVLRALDDAVREGEVLHIGVSNFPAWVVARANAAAQFRGWTMYSGWQLEYSLLERGIEREHLPMAAGLGMTICAWSPLASGILTGKYTRDSADGAPRRLDTVPMKAVNEAGLEVARGVDALADELGRSSAAVALNWVRAKREVIPILGSRNMSQIQDQLGCLEFTLTAEQVARLDGLTNFARGYPYDFISAVRFMQTGGWQDRIDAPPFA